MSAHGSLCIAYKKNKKGEVTKDLYFHKLKTISVSERDADKCIHLMQYDMAKGTVCITFFEDYVLLKGFGFANQADFLAAMVTQENSPQEDDDRDD